MATRPDVDATAIQKLAEDNQQIVYALKLEFDTETIRIHSGLGELTIDGENYTGAGTLLSISDIEDTVELKSSGVTFALSGMNAEVLGYALTENYQNRIATLKMAFLSGGTDHVVGTMTIYVGRMVQINIADDPDSGASITVQTENRLIDLRRPSNHRYTKESQNYLHAGDTSLDEVTRIQNMQLLWGRAYGGGTGGSNSPRSEPPPYEVIPDLP